MYTVVILMVRVLFLLWRGMLVVRFGRPRLTRAVEEGESLSNAVGAVETARGRTTGRWFLATRPRHSSTSAPHHSGRVSSFFGTPVWWDCVSSHAPWTSSLSLCVRKLLREYGGVLILFICNKLMTSIEKLCHYCCLLFYIICRN